ncbi:MAG: radical SAM protein, partial [Parvibaculaceae bacterium]
MWWRSVIPSNSLAAVNALALDAMNRRILGDDVDIELHPVDETNRRFVPARTIAEIRRSGGKALIALVGVQTNQFPRAMDLARPFLAAGIPVCVGGFHVSGCYSMLKTLPHEIEAGRDMGMSYFLGEAE